MGAIYVVEQRSTHELRALKVMNGSLLADDRQRQRFEQEARITAHIPSDHVVKVVGSGIDRETALPWIAMELLEGQTLAEHCLANGRLNPRELRDIFRQLCHALGAAHRAGIIHRDVKPENVFLARSRLVGTPWVVKVLDFGIAKVLAESAPRSITAAVGTPLWMAPEQMRDGARIGPPCDVWALGLIAFAMLTGQDFWRAANNGTMPALLREISIEPIPRASQRANELKVGPLWPTALDNWFARCVDRDPTKRFRDADAAFMAFDEVIGRSSSMIATLDVRDSSPTMQVATAPTLHDSSNMPRQAMPTMINATRTMIDPPKPSLRWGRVFGGAIGACLVGGFVIAAFLGNRHDKAPATCESDPHACLPEAKSLRKGTPEQRKLAIVLLDRACKTVHDTEACRIAAAAHEEGLVGQAARSASMASQHYDRACRADDAGACSGLARMTLLASDSTPQAREQALATLQNACDRREAMACGDLGLLYARGLGGVPVDTKRAEQLFAKAKEGLTASCKKEDPPRSCERLGDAIGKGPEAEAAYVRACDAGLPRACATLGMMHLDSAPEDARARLADACGLGQMNACGALGHMFVIGAGGAADKKLGLARLNEACAAKVWEACDEVAQLETDKKRAFELLDGACKAGHGPACTRYAMMLGDVKEMPRALGLLEAACDSRSEPNACAVLARHYWRGARPADLFKAASRADSGCAANSAKACHVLGEIMERHSIIGRDDAARTHHKKACELGLAVGCTSLARMYVDGRGGPRSLEEAKKLLERACKNGQEDACTMQTNPKSAPRSDFDCVYSHWGECTGRKARSAAPKPQGPCSCATGDPLCACFEPSTPPPPPARSMEEDEAANILQRLKDDAAWRTQQ